MCWIGNLTAYPTQNKTIQWVCDLGDGKGKITRYFFLMGRQKLLITNAVQRFRIQNNIDDDAFEKE
ncbi:MAG: hypothetical protein D6675_06435 [Gemmatimonadetes bacterium]|nr:MAG: hypothetical protein D6675_06435 [Gemmatimonadota bacterium]